MSGSGPRHDEVLFDLWSQFSPQHHAVPSTLGRLVRNTMKRRHSAAQSQQRSSGSCKSMRSEARVLRSIMPRCQQRTYSPELEVWIARNHGRTTEAGSKQDARISGGVCASSPLLSHRLQNCQPVASAANKAQITELATQQSDFPSSHSKSPVRSVNTTCVVVTSQNTEWQVMISLSNRKFPERGGG